VPTTTWSAIERFMVSLVSVVGLTRWVHPRLRAERTFLPYGNPVNYFDLK